MVPGLEGKQHGVRNSRGRNGYKIIIEGNSVVINTLTNFIE